MQWNHVKSFKFEIFYDLERKFKALVIILEIGQFLSEQRAFEKKQLFLRQSVHDSIDFDCSTLLYCTNA